MADEGTMALLAALASVQPSGRVAAARALGAPRDPAATLLLAALLLDGDAAVRYAAADALERIGDPQAVLPILTTLRVLVAPMDLAQDALAFGQLVGLILSRLGPPVGPELIAAAENAMGHLGGRDTTDTLRLEARDDPLCFLGGW